MHLIKDLLQEHEFLIKIRSKRCLFSHTSRQKLMKIYSFSMRRKFVLCLCFGLGRVPLIFTKLLQIPITLIKRNNVRIIIFLDDMLVMVEMLNEVLQAKETLIFLLQNLGFVINSKNSQLIPVKEITFLGLAIKSVNMTLTLPQEKALDIQNKRMQLIASPKTTIMELTKLLRKLSFTAQAVLPGYRCLQNRLSGGEGGRHSVKEPPRW